MSEKRTPQSTDLEKTQQRTNAAPQPARRRLLKGSVAIPVIMTLHSGAALARTSNLVNPVHNVNEAATMAVDEVSEQQIVCAVPDETQDQSGAPPYDLGEVPTGFLVDIPEDGTTDPCGLHGIMISAATLTSLAPLGQLIDPL